MSKEYRTAYDVFKEKYEERGWDQDQELGLDTRDKSVEPIKPLPLSEEEFRNFSLLLAKLALQDKDPALCETYFELQRRAVYGNKYSPIEGISQIEQEMWSLGTGEKTEAVTEDTKKHLH